ncbi:Helix-turn-helix domain-containing protein [Alkalispirochaeta americana]|uniref:Helix-turn-helix domain-containing protein n=1 Tax=Alkalispirochaeta americana TaxID=159291 RepID=A0A1N6XUA3_9SPIO|nr:response regulator [Alkalispirochaeta americana]SIR05866.1 Helix-turn-helix domain-containing protein [Alkalispirochaeta americana]
MAGYNVLVVEDEDLLRANLVRRIHQLDLGFTVISDVMDGQAALDVVHKQLVHLVVTDIRMPVMDGLELAKHLFYTDPNIQVVIISGYGQFEYAQQAMHYGVKEYLTKPIDDEELRRVLTHIKMSLDTHWEDIAEAVKSLSERTTEHLVEAVEYYLRQNYTRTISIQEMARQLNLSSEHLCRVYKRLRSETPMHYLTGLRIQEAKRLLLQNPEADIKNVGEMVGYLNPHYFSRYFKKKTGMSPSEYRSAHQTNQT